MTGVLIVATNSLFQPGRSPAPLVPGTLPVLVHLTRQSIRMVIIVQPEHAALWKEWYQFFIEEGVAIGQVVEVGEQEPGLLACAPQIAAGLGTIDRSKISLIATTPDAPDLALTLGVSCIGINPAMDWPTLADEILFPARRVAVSRQTSETDIAVSLDIDTSHPVQIDTGLAFFDHMLEQIARHSGVSLLITARGDLHIDEHHTIEDTAIALGEAFRKAVGDKRGMARYGFYLPMDEAEARVTLDFSNRPVLEWRVSLSRERVGDFPCEMTEHFFQSLAVAAGMTLHIAATGENDHHIIEAVFKAVGKALKSALQRSGSDAIPSTKGVL